MSDTIAPPATNSVETNELRPNLGFQLPPAVDALVRRSAPELVTGAINTLVAAQPEPIVQPRVRLLLAHDPPWGNRPLRPPGKRNSALVASSADSWAANGCHPTSIAMILDWWDNLNPSTRGRLKFRFPGADGVPSFLPGRSAFKLDQAELKIASGSGGARRLTPLEMCRRLFDAEFVPTAVIAGRGGASTFVVDHDALREGTQAILVQHVSDLAAAAHLIANSVLNPEVGVPKLLGLMQPNKFMLPPDRKQKAAVIKYLLQWGPITAELNNPKHIVVIDGFRGDELFVCDSGTIVHSAFNWSGTGISSRDGNRGLPVIRTDVRLKECVVATPVDVPTDPPPHEFEERASRKLVRGDALVAVEHRLFMRNSFFLDAILNVETYIPDPLGVHVEWSHPSAQP